MDLDMWNLDPTRPVQSDLQLTLDECEPHSSHSHSPLCCGSVLRSLLELCRSILLYLCSTLASHLRSVPALFTPTLFHSTLTPIPSLSLTQSTPQPKVHQRFHDNLHRRLGR